MRNIYLVNCLLLTFASIILSASCEAPVTINDFHAAPSVISKGQSSTLEWDVSGVTRVHINNGIGEVVPTGKRIVTPASTTTYVMTVVQNSKTVTGEVTVTVTTLSAGSQQDMAKPPQGEGAGQGSKAKWTSAVLRYDNLKTESEDYLYEQIAVWHTYAKLAGTPSAAMSFYSNSTRGGALTLGSAGTAIKSPLIILPSGEGMVCIIRNYAQITYRFFDLATSWYGDSNDEGAHLAQPGYGLATVFSPDKLPFKIQKINIAAVANHSGSAEEYEQYHFIVRILDGKNDQIWNKSIPWSYFKSNASTDTPPANWKSINVGDVMVEGDFTVEVLSESNEYATGRNKTFHYLAVAYEEIGDKDVNTKSFISENGIRSDSWVRLYDAYGHPRSFNLCIRVEGSYEEK